MKLPFYLLALFLAMVLPLHAQISTDASNSGARKISPSFSINPTFSLKLDWNLSGGLNGTISRLDPATGEVLAPITGAGIVQSRLVLIEFPGYGDFRGRMSKDGGVIKGRLLFRENPASRPVVRRFTLYRYGGTGGGSVTVTMILSQAVGSVGSAMPRDIDLHPALPADGSNTVVPTAAP